MQFSHEDNRCICEIHLAIPRHQLSNAWPMRCDIEAELNRLAFEQLKQRINCQAVFPQKVCNFSEYRIRYQHRRAHVFHYGNGPLVMGIAAIKICKQWTGVTDDCHSRRNLRRALVAGTPLPARLPARSAVSS